MTYGTLNVDSVVNSDGVTSGGLYGFKNRIINGAMTISQRGTTFATPTNGDYTLDRWRNFQSGGGTYSVAQSTTVPSAVFKSSAVLTVTAADASIASGDYYAYNQYIEGFNTYDFGWGAAGASAVTLSFWVRSSVTGLYAVAFYNNAGDRGYPATFTISAANTWQQITITIPGCTDGTWLTDNSAGVVMRFDLGSGSSANGTANTWNSGGSFAASRTSSTVNWIATAGATFYITGVQLEKGSTATSFDYRPYGTELALCQRYYQRFENISGGEVTGSLSPGMVWTTTTYFAVIPYITTMRALPTGGASASTAITLLVNGAAKQSTSITIQQYSKQSFEIAAGSSGLTAGQAGFVRLTSATDYIALSAEL